MQRVVEVAELSAEQQVFAALVVTRLPPAADFQVQKNLLQVV